MFGSLFYSQHFKTWDWSIKRAPDVSNFRNIFLGRTVESPRIATPRWMTCRRKTEAVSIGRLTKRVKLKRVKLLFGGLKVVAIRRPIVMWQVPIGGEGARLYVVVPKSRRSLFFLFFYFPYDATSLSCPLNSLVKVLHSMIPNQSRMSTILTTFCLGNPKQCLRKQAWHVTGSLRTPNAALNFAKTNWKYRPQSTQLIVGQWGRFNWS